MARRWLADDLAHTYIPALKKLKDTSRGRGEASQLLHRMRENWSQQHGLTTLQQQQGCMDQVRRAIKDALGEEHWSLEVIRFSREEYVELNNQKQGRVSQRNEAVQQLDDPDAIVATAVRLLNSPEWAEVAAGLAVLTGRRVSELLATAQFEQKSRWSVIFRGAVKRGNEQGLQFEIPTLTTAERVCTALDKIRRELPQAQDMSVGKINQSYEPAVVRACQKHFEGLVPTRDGKDNLYTHLFRAVYATIATFWYCPPSVNETEFRAAIQGHFQILDEHNPELRRSLVASRHYADYEISDRVIAQHQGKRKGIKLGVGGIEPIEMFKDAMIQATREPVKGRRKTSSSIRLWKEDKTLVKDLFERLGLDGNGKQEDRMRVLLEWVDAHLKPGGALAEGDRIEELAEKQTESDSVPSQVREKEQEKEQEKESGRSDWRKAEEPDPLRSDLQELTATLKQFMPLLVQGVVSSTPQVRVSAPQVQVVDPQARAALMAAAAAEETATQHRRERKNSTKPQTLKRVNQAIDAIIAYNNQPDRRHDDKWAITINALKSWVSSAPTIMEVLELRQEEIDHHHQRHGIDPEKHNYRHRRKRKIDQVIKVEEE